MADPKTDPWADVAAEYQKEQSTTPRAPQGDQPGFLARTSEALGLTQHPVNQLKAEISQFASHPIDTTIQAGKQVLTGARDAANNLSPVKFDESGAHLNNPLTAARDMVGGQRFAEDVQNGNYKGAAGTLVGNAIPVAIGGASRLATPVEETNSALSKAAIAKPAASRVTTDIQARNITKAVNPAVNEWDNYIEATQHEGGNIRDYALRNKLPLKTQLDWSKAAQGAADEANEHFKSTVLGPHANERASVSGTGYQGSVGEGQNATLGEINDRISKINNLLRPAYNKKQPGQVMTAVENEADLQAEKQALTRVLHDELAKKAGITPEQIGQMRQRFGRSYSIADQTGAAVNQRQSSEGKIIEGRRDVPQSLPSMISEGFNRFVRGGPEKIADKRFVKSLNESKLPAQSLPEIAPPPEAKSPRVPLWKSKK